MKILWIADFGLHHNIGGSQRTDSFVIDEGRNRGHEIITFNYDSQDSLLAADYDMIVTNNLESLCRRQNVFEFILNHKNHIRFEHDSNSYLVDSARKMLFGSTRKSIFLSDFHYKTFVNLYGDIFPNSVTCSPFIDTTTFRDMGQEREDKTLYVGFFHILKGTNNFINHAIRNPNKKFVVAGWGDPFYENHMRSLSNVEFIGKVKHEEMPILFNKYKHLYYHPEKFEPFCRSIGEAIMCGIIPDTNEIIGAVHDYNNLGLETMRHNCSTSNKKWWEIVE